MKKINKIWCADGKQHKSSKKQNQQQRSENKERKSRWRSPPTLEELLYQDENLESLLSDTEIQCLQKSHSKQYSFRKCSCLKLRHMR